MKQISNPKRLAKNVPGPFYTMGGCLACGTPESEAPELLASLEGENYETYFVEQPSTPIEVEHACKALEVCCVSDLRYAGEDRAVIYRLGNSPEFCDLVLATSGELVDSCLTTGELKPEFARVVGRQHFARRNRFSTSLDGELITWRLPWAPLDAKLKATPARLRRDRRRTLFAAIAVGVVLAAWLYTRGTV